MVWQSFWKVLFLLVILKFVEAVFLQIFLEPWSTFENGHQVKVVPTSGGWVVFGITGLFGFLLPAVLYRTLLNLEPNTGKSQDA